MECEIISEDEACKVVIDTSILIASLWKGKTKQKKNQRILRK